MNSIVPAQNRNGDNQFDFIINPELHQDGRVLTPGAHLDVVFIVRNVSGRPVRAEALLRLQRIPGENGTERGWPILKLQEPAEWVFEHTGVRAYTVQLTVPAGATPGIYNFQMVMVGIDDPDKEVVDGGLVSVEVRTPPADVLPFVLKALAVLVAVILLVAGMAVLLPKKGLAINLKQSPSTITVGVPAQYEVEVLNRRGEPVNGVLLTYEIPAAVIGASAYVPNSPVRNCEKIESSQQHSLRCDLGKLEPGKSVTVSLEIIPGPLDQALGITQSPTLVGEAITLQQTLRVTGDKGIDIPVSLPNREIEPPPVTQPFSVVLDPSSKTGLVHERMDITIRAWRNTPDVESITFIYQLPKGMRFMKEELPVVCQQPVSDYFSLMCTADLTAGSASIIIPVVPVEVSPGGFVHGLTWVDQADDVPEPTLKTPVVYPPLLFNGINDWVELGYASAPKTFTAEMWIEPFSVEDGQAFIGAHRQYSKTVLNMFLVGYYSGTLSVNVSGMYCDLNFQKTTERFHLAVVVDNKSEDEWWVTVYKNGTAQPWREQAAQAGGCTIPKSQTQARCKNCAIFKQSPPQGEEQESLMKANRLDGGETLAWVLGQEWDSGGQGPKPSDFFHGALSEVRLWNTARTQQDVSDTMALRPLGSEQDLDAYWRLEPVAPADSSDPVLANLTSGQYDGKRYGSAWGDPVPGFGNALAFNGINDFLWAPGLSTDDLDADKNGKVNLTLAGWFHVDGVPTRQQWLMGFVPVGLSPAAPVPEPAVLADLPVTDTQSPEAKLAAAQIQEKAKKTADRVQEKETAVAQAQAKLAAAKTPAEQQSAQTALELARAERDAALRQWYKDLHQTVLQQQHLETLLDNLSARLDLAVEGSLEAGLAAIAIQDNSTPPPTASIDREKIIHGAALLSARQALKSEVNASVDKAWKDYQDRLEEYNRMIANTSTLPTDATQAAAIASLKEKVEESRAAFSQSLADQRAQQGELEVQPQVAEDLSQMVARRVTDEIVAKIQSAEQAGSKLNQQEVLRIKLEEMPGITKTLKRSLFTQLETARWRVRLFQYIYIYYARYWLSYDLAAGGDRVEVRTAKTDMQAALTELDLALLDALWSQPVWDSGENFETLLQQAADGVGRTAIQVNLQETLQKAEESLSRYLSLADLSGEPAASSESDSAPDGTEPSGLELALAPAEETASSPSTATPSLEAGTTQPLGPTASPTPATSATPTPLPSPQDNQLANPANIWAGLILTDDGHVALVARPISPADWVVFKDERLVAVGQWVHYAVTIAFDPITGEVDLDSLQLVRNGVFAKGTAAESSSLVVQVDQANCPAGSHIQPGFYIGGLCQAGGKFDFQGQIDEVHVWNRKLSDNDVNRLRNMPGVSYDELAYWPFDELLGIRPNECQNDQACNYGAGDGYHLDVSGPMWVPAEFSEQLHTSVRP